MSRQPLTFNFVTQSVRVIMIEGAPWFVAVDVCSALGLPNVTRAQRLDEDERSQLIDSNTLNNNQDNKINNLLNVINESGLYALILTSRKPEAKTFKKWVTSEVLPALRKHGKYELSGPVPEAFITLTIKRFLGADGAPRRAFRNGGVARQGDGGNFALDPRKLQRVGKS